MRLRIVVVALISGLLAVAAESGLEMYQRAVTQERAGKLDEAIKLYERVAHDFASDRALAAKALLQAARGYEKFGQDKAIKLYEQVARDFGDQRESADAARMKLAARRQGVHAVTAMTQRKLDPPVSVYATEWGQPFLSDGEHSLYFDDAAGALISSDPAGGNKRVIFKPKPGNFLVWRPSRDFSMVLLASGLTDQPANLAVIRADGSGWREFPGTGTRLDHTGCLGWSWDNRYVVTCTFGPDGTKRFLSVSVNDGQTRQFDLSPDNTTPNPIPRFSPDSRFIAYQDGARGPGVMNVVIAPVQGGKPTIKLENARLLDWTRDGRFLALASQRSGAEALYLLPVKDGQSAGDPIFIRYGSFLGGLTSANGALLYWSVPRGGIFSAGIAALDSSGRVGEWRPLSLRMGNGRPQFNWSPDGARIVYSVARDDSGQPGTTVVVRDLASGEEHAVYRDEGPAWCTWAPNPNLICGRFPEQGQTEIFSVVPDSGRTERISSLPGFVQNMYPSRDGRTFYSFKLFKGVPGYFRWEIGSNRDTPLYDHFSPPAVRPSSDWIPRLVNGRDLEIRPTSGGEWRRLVTLNTRRQGQDGAFPIEYTPDGKWILYGDRDAAGRDSLFRVSPGGGTPERMGDFPEREWRRHCWAPHYTRPCALALRPHGTVAARSL